MQKIYARDKKDVLDKRALQNKLFCNALFLIIHDSHAVISTGDYSCRILWLDSS